jgi:hypothetical protein
MKDRRRPCPKLRTAPGAGGFNFPEITDARSELTHAIEHSLLDRSVFVEIGVALF